MPWFTLWGRTLKVDASEFYMRCRSTTKGKRGVSVEKVLVSIKATPIFPVHTCLKQGCTGALPYVPT
jgi:hypothetical protein